MYGNDPNQQYYGQQSGYGGYPQPGYPQPGYPQPGYPQPGYPQPGYPQPGYPQSNYPPQSEGFESSGGGEAKGFEFNDASIRRGFIRKVYGILSVQLGVSVAFICLCAYHKGTQLFLKNHSELFWVALVVLFVTMIAMACCETVRRTSPTNFIFLGLFTLAQSFMLGTMTSHVDHKTVMLAVGTTGVICFALTLFALQTKFDFTVCNGVLFVAMILFMVFGIVTIFWKGPIINLVYASVGALLFSIYLVYDTQLMMGGNHKYSISPEEYIFAALNLYMDIVNIFIYILTIISAARDD
ncbi:protein lifeguard 1-like isoform X2 [Contarinia nasturtii]|uniref:protein lifeguard 1-like isoform X2 n=1 Tax=Contarinia nasturtii TaxID=265458 RepID=UPI0012D49B61|nr:protein lifeguard 1-like isoform X2 [Contarinia nasturtii]